MIIQWDEKGNHGLITLFYDIAFFIYNQLVVATRKNERKMSEARGDK